MKTKTQTLEQMIVSRKFDYVNPNITSKLFPEEKIRNTDYKLFHFDKYISSKDALKEMEKEGYVAVNIYELLNWQDWNNEDYIVALGSVGAVVGGRYVPFLYRLVSRRGLYLNWWGLDWNARYRFLGIKVGSKGERLLHSNNEICKHEINYCPKCGEKI